MSELLCGFFLWTGRRICFEHDLLAAGPHGFNQTQSRLLVLRSWCSTQERDRLGYPEAQERRGLSMVGLVTQCRNGIALSMFD